MASTISFQQLRIRILLTVILSWALPAISFKLFFELSPLPGGFADRFVIPDGVLGYVIASLVVAHVFHA